MTYVDKMLCPRCHPAYFEAFAWTEAAPPELPYQRVTGRDGHSNVDYLTDGQILEEIEIALASGKGVIWRTFLSPSTLDFPMHAYSVSRVDIDPVTGTPRVILWNPHGYPEYVLFADLWENLGALTILNYESVCYLARICADGCTDSGVRRIAAAKAKAECLHRYGGIYDWRAR